MATISWISEGLPTEFALPAGGEDVIDAFVDDEPDVGAPRRRAISTRTLRRWPNVTVPGLSRAQVEAVDNFYHQTTVRGSLTFDFPRPRRKAADGSFVIVEVRFVKGSYRINPPTGDGWSVSFGVYEV